MNLIDTAKAVFSTSAVTWVVGASVLSFAGGSVFGWHERVLREPAMIEAQKAVDLKQCNIDKQVTRRANVELQENRNRIANDAARYKQLHPVRCVIPAAKANIQHTGAEYAGVHGVSSEWLHGYAARCELYRTELKVCEEFDNEGDK